MHDPNSRVHVGCSATNTKIYKQLSERVGRREYRFQSVAEHVGILQGGWPTLPLLQMRQCLFISPENCPEKSRRISIN